MKTENTLSENTLHLYDGKIYRTGDSRGIDGFCLRFRSGSFHYVGRDVLREAINAGFKIGYSSKVYSRMPWGMQHSGYEYNEKPEWMESLINKLNQPDYDKE